MPSCYLFLFVVFLVVIFLVAQLDFVVEMGLLQQFAQVAGAQIRRKRLLFIVVEVVFVGLCMMMGRVELLFFNQLFFKLPVPGAYDETGDFDRNLRLFNRLRRWLLGLLLATQSKQSETRRRRWIHMMGSGRVVLALFRNVSLCVTLRRRSMFLALLIFLHEVFGSRTSCGAASSDSSKVSSSKSVLASGIDRRVLIFRCRLGCDVLRDELLLLNLVEGDSVSGDRLPCPHIRLDCRGYRFSPCAPVPRQRLPGQQSASIPNHAASQSAKAA